MVSGRSAGRFQSRSIDDVLNMTVDDGLELFEEFAHGNRPLRLPQNMGLGYPVPGQPVNTLSGGEAKRLKISAESAGRCPSDVLYVQDEPTTGLHADDVDRPVDVLQRLVDTGNTVMAVEHTLDFIAPADSIIDLDPGGGEDGGRIVATGIFDEMADRLLGLAGGYLRDWLGM